MKAKAPNKRVLALLLVIVAILAGVKYYQRTAEAHEHEQTLYTALRGEVFHTFYQIKYSDQIDYSEQIDSVFHGFSQSLNPFDPTSLVSAINKNESVRTDSMLRHVWRAAQRISQASAGRYDVTCSPLINAWGFGFGKAISPSSRVIDSLRALVGYTKIRLSGDSLIKADPRMVLDFSSISKGYCADLTGQMLRQKNVEHYMVELGGEISFRGHNPEGKPWTIGINKPIDDASGLIQDFELIIALDRTEGGLATSGNYRNYKIVNGKKVGHTINPHTGYPVQTDVLSATVLAPNCMLADGLATACMTMSSDEVPAFMAHFPQTEFLLILAEGADGFRTVMSDGFGRLVVKQ